MNFESSIHSSILHSEKKFLFDRSMFYRIFFFHILLFERPLTDAMILPPREEEIENIPMDDTNDGEYNINRLDLGGEKDPILFSFVDFFPPSKKICLIRIESMAEVSLFVTKRSVAVTGAYENDAIPRRLPSLNCQF